MKKLLYIFLLMPVLAFCAGDNRSVMTDTNGNVINNPIIVTNKNIRYIQSDGVVDMVLTLTNSANGITVLRPNTRAGTNVLQRTVGGTNYFDISSLWTNNLQLLNSLTVSNSLSSVGIVSNMIVRVCMTNLGNSVVLGGLSVGTNSQSSLTNKVYDVTVFTNSTTPYGSYVTINPYSASIGGPVVTFGDTNKHVTSLMVRDTSDVPTVWFTGPNNEQVIMQQGFMSVNQGLANAPLNLNFDHVAIGGLWDTIITMPELRLTHPTSANRITFYGNGTLSAPTVWFSNNFSKTEARLYETNNSLWTSNLTLTGKLAANNLVSTNITTWLPATQVIQPDRSLGEHQTYIITNSFVLDFPTNKVESSLCREGERIRMKLVVTNRVTTGFVMTLTNAYNTPIGSGIGNTLTLASNSTSVVTIEKVGTEALQTNRQWLVESYLSFTNRY